MAGVAFAAAGDGVGFATESYAASALYTPLASLSGALWRIRRASNNDANALTMRGCRSEAKECVRTVVEHDIRRRPPLRARRQIGLLTPLAFRPGRLTGIFRRSHCQPRQLDIQCAAGRDGHVLFPDDGSPSHGGRLAC